ncbi:electron transfer flavoprotein-ubiquinone oxidoreductase [Vibrio sp. V39_P1S14PM300]|uniref:electron transfer flavoprotein-ubiquinone oxidoreductase n=1 Tax=Vibrio sp. V39_P1S14PM300 TaxID=1938690 RepID=UPI00137370E6|nr:electron transfer flavoprotein-ubiquinone oxidoreductase [Vibrio sp. V39_P1S14PM300]NAX23581.1 FAD-binding protein [Vibrio sp. V39_P1S14PM300]
MERESMEFDVVIVGAGPAGLSAACKLAQLNRDSGGELSICVVEKGAEVGSHIISGALFETTALDELFPDWQSMNAPLQTRVKQDEFLYLTTENNHVVVPGFATPEPMKNSEDNYVISLAELCRWLSEQASELGVEIFPGFPAANVNIDANGAVSGITTTDMGLDKNGQPKSNFEPGINLNAKYTIFAEGSRGHLGKQLIEHYHLDAGKQPQHYAIGLKEIWEVPNASPGQVIHAAGWPLREEQATGGSFLYHLDDKHIAVGLIVDLNYRNPYLSPFDEFQRLKHHPVFRQHLKDGQRIAYGARAITKGGLSSLPKQQFPGGVLVGCDAGTLNGAKIKGNHTAMKSGMLAAEAVYDALEAGHVHSEPDYQGKFEASWLYQELHSTRNFVPAIHKFGSLCGGALAAFEHNFWKPVFKHSFPRTLTDKRPDHSKLMEKNQFQPIEYPKPDGILSFDKPSSVYLSGTQHEENQPCHLVLSDPNIPVDSNLPRFDEPAQRYCPAGVYEIVMHDNAPALQINAANCVHCKTCDIKDPAQNINWVPPEGGGGPNYQNM